eukprot:g15798.t1
MQPDFEHVPETVLNTSAYLDVIIEIINNKAGVREDDEKRRAFKSAIVDQHRHREESLSQFAVRRQKEFSNAAAYGVIIPDSFKATMLREGAGLNDQNQQNLTALLQGHDEDPNAVARALARLDVRSDRMAAYVEPHSSTDSFASTVEENDDEEEDSLDEAELMKELEPLDLTEDQVNEVFAVLENKKRKPRTWKENKLFKAEMRKERTSFVKGDDKTPHGRKPDGHFRGRRNALNREQLKKISRCKLCLKKGHWAEDCDMNKANKKSAPPSAFSYSSSQNGPSQSAFSYCTMSLLRESLSEVLATGQKLEAQWNFLTIPSGDAILDIGATQDLIGETALSSMAHHLKHLGLQFVEATQIVGEAMNILQVQNTQLANALTQINQSLQQLAHGQGQMIMMANTNAAYPAPQTGLYHQTQGQMPSEMQVDMMSDHWSATEAHGVRALRRPGPEQALGGLRQVPDGDLAAQDRPPWLPTALLGKRLRGASQAPPDEWDVVWCRVLEESSGHLLVNMPTIGTTLPEEAYQDGFITDIWGAPRDFLTRLTLARPDSPILSFDATGHASPAGPFWAFEVPHFDEPAEETLTEMSNQGHQTDLLRCHRNLTWLSQRAVHQGGASLDFVELFSPARVAPLAQKLGLRVDLSQVYDIKGGWDVRKKSNRQLFRKRQHTQKPKMLMASPECRAFTQLRYINQDRTSPEAIRATLAEGLLMWDFSLEAIKEQICQDNYFALEHPEWAASWTLPQSQQLVQRPEVCLIAFDQCMFGLSVVPDGTLSRKGTKMATNNPWLAFELCMAQCRGDHEHRPLIGGLPQQAQEYPRALCMAIARSAKAASMGAPAPSFIADYEPTVGPSWNCSFFGEEEDDEEEAPTRLGEEESGEIEIEKNLPQATASQRRLVQKVHVNTGHPDRTRMLRAFKAAGALPQILRFIKEEFSCEDCNLKQGPDVRRRAQLPRTFAFNKVLCLDFLFVKFKEQRIPILNMVCGGTSYQIAVRAPVTTTHGGTPSSATTWKLFVESWQRYFGMPQLVVCDSGNEFRGPFERGLELAGVLQHVILPECPWQNGRAERHGGWLKNRLDSELHGGRCNLESLEELDEFLAALTSVKNRWLCRGGYTPAQLVFGELPRIPGELLAEDELALHGMHDAHADPLAVDEAAGEYRRRHEIRERARQLAMQQASTDAIRRSVHAATHQQRVWTPGQWVYVFRRAKQNQDLHLRSRWVGPGVVVLANNDTVYVGMRSRLWRCSPEQLRAALPSEILGRDLISDPGLGELLRQVVTGTQAGAVDVSKEGNPSPQEMLGPVQRDERGVNLGPDSRVEECQLPLHQPSETVPVEAPRSPTWVPPGLLPNVTPLRTSSPLPAVPEEAEAEDLPQRVPHPPPGLTPNQSRRQSINEPASEPAAPSTAGEIPTMTRGISDHSGTGSDEISEPPTKQARLDDEEEGTHTRAPGTPVDRLLSRIPREATSSSSVQPPLTPAETLPPEGRVTQQVQEFENLRQQRQDTLADDELELWSGSLFNYSLGDTDLHLDKSGQWNFMAKRNDEISLKDLSREEKTLFDQSDEVEWGAVTQTGAVDVIYGKEAEAARKQYPDRILSSRMVRRKKPQPELHSWKAKSRWCIHGHVDPDTKWLSTYAPTPQGEGLMLFLQTALNLGMTCAFADVKNAFCQSRPLQRERGPLFAEPCEGLRLQPGALIRILVPVYGLDDAPAEWRRTVTSFLTEDLGFKRNLVEPCWFSRYSEQGKCTAQVLVEVDDFIVTALPSHYEALRQAMTKRFHFGKWEKDEAEYAGRHVRVTPEAIYVDQAKYITEQIHPIQLPRGRRGQHSMALNEEEFKALRSLIFKINWVGRESRPEAAGIASLMASRLPQANVGDVAIVNRFVNFLRTTASRPLKLWKFDPFGMCFIAVSDAGGINMQGSDLVDHDGLPMDATQGAWMVLTAEKLPQGKTAVRASPITWRSSRLRRKVFSTFGGETQAMLQGVNEVDWLQVMYRDAVYHDVQLSSWRNCLSPHMLVMRGQCHLGGRQQQCSVTDAKSLFDCLLRENPTGKQDRKSALELAIILKDLQETKSMVRWVPHQKMLVDGLTKLDPLKANDALHQFIRSGWLSLVDVQEELGHRKEDPAFKRRTEAAACRV